jgi:hypothetical protein
MVARAVSQWGPPSVTGYYFVPTNGLWVFELGSGG